MTWLPLATTASRWRRYRKSKRPKSLSALSTFRGGPAAAPRFVRPEVGRIISIDAGRCLCLARPRGRRWRSPRRPRSPRACEAVGWSREAIIGTAMRAHRAAAGALDGGEAMANRAKSHRRCRRGREGHKGALRQSIELLIGCRESGRRVGARAWKGTAAKAPGQAPAGAAGLPPARQGAEQPTSRGGQAGFLGRPCAMRPPPDGTGRGPISQIFARRF